MLLAGRRGHGIDTVASAAVRAVQRRSRTIAPGSGHDEGRDGAEGLIRAASVMKDLHFHSFAPAAGRRAFCRRPATRRLRCLDPPQIDVGADAMRSLTGQKIHLVLSHKY